MGINKIDRLQQVLLEVRDHNSPVAIIQDGTLNTQKVYISTISNLEKIVRENNVKSPAIIVVGEVIKLRNKLWQLS